MTVTQDYKNLTISADDWTQVLFIVAARIETARGYAADAKRMYDGDGLFYWTQQQARAEKLSRHLARL